MDCRSTHEGSSRRANHLKVVDVAQVVDGVTLVRAVALLSTVIQVPARRKRGASMRCKQTNERANKHNQPQTQTLNPTTPLSTTLATLPSPCADSPHPSIHVFCQRKFRDPNLKRKIFKTNIYYSGSSQHEFRQAAARAGAGCTTCDTEYSSGMKRWWSNTSW